MSVGQAIRISRTARHMTQKDFEKVGYERTMISKVEVGKRKAAPDMVTRLSETVRHPALAFESAVEYSGGYGSRWLDGPNVDSHRSAVAERTRHEVREALDALQGFATYNPPSTTTEGDRRRLHELMYELLDARQWIDFFAAVCCEEYGLDFLGINIEHHKRLKSMRLIGE